jgi:hypothetical protein
MALLLYSTNTHLKYRINQLFFGGVHYVWCSETFDCRSLGRYDVGAMMPPSSDPLSIYLDLRDAIKRTDLHCAKIADQKSSLSALAAKCAGDGKISDDDRDEVLGMIERATAQDWRPLIYLIPLDPVKARLQLVPVARRASNEPEFIIPDLQRSEFEIIEPDR